MQKTTTIALTALLTASIALPLGFLLNRPQPPLTPPTEDLTAALQQFQDTADTTARAQNEKLQAAIDQLVQANQSIQKLTDQVAALSQQNQNLNHQLQLIQSEFADPNIPPITLAGLRFPVTFDANSVIPPPSADTIKANTGAINKNIEDFIVFVTKTGKKYHRPDCSSLNKSKIPLTLTEAIARGYTPCTRCKPPPLINH